MPIYPGVIIDYPLIHARRNPQIKTGFLTNGEDKRSGDTIQTPRKTPLESTWKRANANVFE